MGANGPGVYGTNNSSSNVGFNRNNNGNDMNISSFKTSKSSKDYPHTKAVLIREAKYQYIHIGKGQGQWELLEGFLRGRNTDQQTPTNQPDTTQQAPTGQAEPNQQQQAPTGQAEPNQQQQAPAEKQEPAEQAPAGVSQAAQEVIDLTNEQRKQNGLPALKADAQLSGVAQKKSVDMQQNGYFSHTSPTYGSPFDMMRDQGVSYKSAGENIAQGQQTPQEVVKAWMDSPGHRKNILSADFTHIGVGYEQSGNHWTQMFISK